MELLKQQAAGCGPECGCNATGTPGKTRLVIDAMLLIAAGALVVRAIIKSDGAASQTTAPAFAVFAASPTPAGKNVTATNPVVAKQRRKRAWEQASQRWKN